jgi:hypothetical protein
MHKIILFCLILSSPSLIGQKKNDQKALEIIKKSVDAHGGKNYKNLDIKFDFRQFSYHIKLNKNTYFYQRNFKDSIGNKIEDAIDNGNFTRSINGKKVELSEKDQSRFKEATNSVAYFMLLPYKLLDKAVNLEYLGETAFENNEYHKIKVWFDEEGGGRDHEDIYCYWINKQTNLVDYLAYANGGPRLRKVIKRDVIDGVTYQNYDNYQILDKEIPANLYDQAFKDGKYKLLSKIEQNNYKGKK